MLLARTERAQTADGIAARQDHHFHTALAIYVQRKQLLDQRQRDAGFSRNMKPRTLQRLVFTQIARFVDFVFFFEVKERPRRNRDHQLVVQRERHARVRPGTACRRGSRLRPTTDNPRWQGIGRTQRSPMPALERQREWSWYPHPGSGSGTG